MKVVEYTWQEFRTSLFRYASKDRQRREQLVFRGHADADWQLQTTLDRDRTFTGDDDRAAHVTALLMEFRGEAIRLGLDETQLPDGEALELLARHHGLPSPLLDVTESPYVAAFFACDFWSKPKSGRVAIWMIDRARFPTHERGLDIIDDKELVRFNRRAIQQRGQFVRVATVREPLEKLLDHALVKFVVPANDQAVALADLDEMGVNSTSLFGDLDGAARTARSRLAK